VIVLRFWRGKLPHMTAILYCTRIHVEFWHVQTRQEFTATWLLWHAMIIADNYNSLNSHSRFLVIYSARLLKAGMVG